MTANQTPFRFDGQFFKGNLHCHSTQSDGKLTHDAIIRMYRERGYSFLCFSDHEIYTDLTGLDQPDFITLPGVEWSRSPVESGQWTKTHHVHGVRGTAAMVAGAVNPPLVHGETLPEVSWTGGRADAEDMMAYLTSRGCFCIYNHPLWSRTKPHDFGDLKGYSAIELYNFGCDLESHTGLCDIYWDDLLQKGIRINAVATDDNHNRMEISDSFGGWICVKARELSHEAIVSAILSGCYYSSSGPEIMDISIEDGVVRVSCSPVHHVNFIAGNYIGAGYTHWGEGGDAITCSEYRLSGREAYVRVECVDQYGKAAWSNPFYLT